MARGKEDVALIRCPGCGRKTLGSIARCTHCRTELGVSAGLPPAVQPSRSVERCALCGQSYDATAHDACPHCAQRLEKKRRELEDIPPRRSPGELVMWSLGMVVVTALGWLAQWGAQTLLPTFGLGTGLWLAAGGGGLVMGLLAGWRLRDRTTTESVVALIGIGLATTVWIRAAVIWANGFNLEGAAKDARCAVVQRDGERARLRCARDGETFEGSVVRETAAEAVSASFRRGRMGYWVVERGSVRPAELEGASDGDEDALPEAE
jgi:hypothetical protein